MIRAVARALAIFDAFDSEHLSLSLQEIAERIRMPKTTAFRLVSTLERAGFLIRIDNQHRPGQCRQREARLSRQPLLVGTTSRMARPTC